MCVLLFLKRRPKYHNKRGIFLFLYLTPIQDNVCYNNAALAH